MSDLDKKLSIWITEEQLGTIGTLRLPERTVQYHVPKEIDGSVTLRFKGYGKTKNGETGDVLLLVRMARGKDVAADLWLSQSEAASGCLKPLCCNGEQRSISLPAGRKDLEIVRIRKGGRKLPYRWGLPIFGRERGDLVIRLRVFPDTVVPVYRSSENLSADSLSLEGWIYRRYDEVIKRLGDFPHKLPPFSPVDAAGLFNQGGWRGVAEALVQRLRLRFASIKFKASPTLKMPGQCQTQWYNGTAKHTVLIRSEFLDDPFVVTAILAHELCHVVELRKFNGFNRHRNNARLAEEDLRQIERTVDLMVFLFQLGEFQMRVARARKITFGYFNQELFERMYVILSRKRATAGV